MDHRTVVAVLEKGMGEEEDLQVLPIDMIAIGIDVEEEEEEGEEEVATEDLVEEEEEGDIERDQVSTVDGGGI